MGFDKPGSIASVEPIYGMGGISVAKAYSIGELIEMLPDYVSIWDTHHPDTMERQWIVGYLWAQNNIVKSELIDALYGMIVKLKEE